MVKRIILFGASGCLGRSVLARLIHKKYNILCIVRNKDYADKLKNKGIEVIDKDILDIKKFNFAKDDVIINVSGILGGFNISKKTLERNNIETIRKIINSCKNQKVIHCSSAGVLGPIVDGDENSPLNPSNDYEYSKAEGEKIVRAYNNFIILRPEFIFGPKNVHTLPLFKLIQKNKFRIIGDGKTFLHPTYIEDVADIIVSCIEKDIINEIIIIAGERPIMVEELYNLICKELKIKPNKIKIPKYFAYIAAFLSETFAKTFNVTPLITFARVKFFTESRSFKIDKARKIVGFNPIKLEEGIKKTINYYKKEGML